MLAGYSIDHDLYQMVRLAVASLKRVVDGDGDWKGFDGDHSVYRHGL